MPWPHITALYLAALALVYAALAIHVIWLRGRTVAAFGDGDNPTLRGAIRSHANLAEYVPIIALMVAMLEVSGASPVRVHVLMMGLLLSRLMHPLGMQAKPATLQQRIFRTGAIWLTLAILIASATSLLTRALRAM
jgi:uncharacterized membrane protein YecN with MAPEG domain